MFHLYRLFLNLVKLSDKKAKLQLQLRQSLISGNNIVLGQT